MIDFGLYLRQLRKEKNESLLSLSEKLGVGVPFLSALENGKKTIPLDYGDKLTDVLNLTKEESINLKNSIDYSNRKIQINLDNLNSEQQEVSLAFARTINQASQKKLEELRKLLEKED